AGGGRRRRLRLRAPLAVADLRRDRVYVSPLRRDAVRQRRRKAGGGGVPYGPVVRWRRGPVRVQDDGAGGGGGQAEAQVRPAVAVGLAVGDAGLPEEVEGRPVLAGRVEGDLDPAETAFA